MQAERRLLAAKLLGRVGHLPTAATVVLDVGCGRGDELAALLQMGAREENLWGIDLMASRVAIARSKLPHAHIACGNAEHIESPDGFFDLVLLFTVFSSIRDCAMAARLASEIKRVLKPAGHARPGGAVLWYDMRVGNPWNPNNVAMGRRRVANLFSSFDVHLQSVTVAPPVARRLGPATTVLYPLLSSVPAFRSHYLGVLVAGPEPSTNLS
jgi:SAM-dependent methyltransferase